MSPPSPRRAVFVTSKYWRDPIQVGFHFLARSFARAGWDVVFLTTQLSWLAAAFGKRRRLARAVRGGEANRLVEVEGVRSYVWFTPWHPTNLRLDVLNRATSGLFRRYGRLTLDIEPLVAAADRFVFDSGPELLLFERFKALNPRAAFVYRVSDDIRHAGVHPLVVETEERVAPLFDLVSVPCAHIERRFRGLPRLSLHHHGVEKALFDRAHPDPYAGPRRPRAVFVGRHALDLAFVETAVRLYPDWTFHIIGPIPGLPCRDNLVAHGELPVASTVPFIAHADIGLHTLAHGDGAEAFSDSLKVIQYTYCRLPIVAPSFLGSGRPNVHVYDPGNQESIRSALERARRFDRGLIDTSAIRSWDEVAALLGSGAAGAAC